MKFILGVCGSISAYRSLDICRQLAKSHHQVKVILTRGAEEFVKPEVFKYLGAQEVFLARDDFNLNAVKERSVLHIELSKWADRVLIAPASANTLAKMANGQCDDLLTSLFLASSQTPFIIFPAMNTNMLNHPLTRKNFERLKELSNVFIHPSKEGLLACGDEGAGKLQDVDLIAEIAPLINLDPPKRKVLIIAGATVAPLDPVRYLANPSSGLTGYELAKRHLQIGDAVTIIAGFNASEKIDYLASLPRAKVFRANTTAQAFELVKKLFGEHDIYISSAALSDIEFETSNEKLKKDQLEDHIKIKRAPDILKEMLAMKKNQQIVGFAAESSDELAVFEKKWRDKPVDVLVGNKVSNGLRDAPIGFGATENNYIILKNGKAFFQGNLSKSELAQKIDEALEN